MHQSNSFWRSNAQSASGSTLSQVPCGSLCAGADDTPMQRHDEGILSVVRVERVSCRRLSARTINAAANSPGSMWTASTPIRLGPPQSLLYVAGSDMSMTNGSEIDRTTR